jgi:hypothetical protein
VFEHLTKPLHSEGHLPPGRSASLPGCHWPGCIPGPDEKVRRRGVGCMGLVYQQHAALASTALACVGGWAAPRNPTRHLPSTCWTCLLSEAPG